jgi:hypothetical protein
MYPHIFEEGTPEHDKAKQLAAKTWDISKFLVAKTGIKQAAKTKSQSDLS